ncbi:MAG TPA: hypothetical protein VJK05_03740 [archaeon]|nr:hypothetical protein [archaeon]
MNSRGQEEAPFELLIAVILMTFVIFVGLQALDELNRQQCTGQINSKMEQVKSVLETITRGKGQQNLALTVPDCGKNPSLRLTEETSSYTCSTYCGGNQSICVLLRYQAGGVAPITKCVGISPLTEFASQDTPSSCIDRSEEEKLVLQDWDNPNASIQAGNYVLVSAFSVSADPNPLICAYRKEGI